MDPARRLDAGSTALLTDSGVDLPAALRPPNWRVVPLTIVFGDEALRDGIDLDAAAFYRRLTAADRLPTTAQPSVEDLAAAMRVALERHDSVVALHLSEKLSGTAEAARAAARAVGEERVMVLESGAASLALALLCLRVQARLEAGTTAGELAAAVEALRAGQRTGVCPATLEYLQRGGRIGRAQAMAGSLLRVRPILVIEDGEVGPGRPGARRRAGRARPRRPGDALERPGPGAALRVRPCRESRGRRRARGRGARRPPPGAHGGGLRGGADRRHPHRSRRLRRDLPARPDGRLSRRAQPPCGPV